jgi:hypothetical protein
MKRVLSALLLSVVSAEAAYAAEVRTDEPCYREGADVQMTATRFTPGSVFVALLDGVRLGGGLVEQAGAVQATFPAPRLNGGSRERPHAVGVLDAAGLAAATTFRVARTSARVTPQPRDPRTARVRFDLYGMGPGRPAVTVAWIAPRGRLRRTARLGRASGPCGRLRTAPRRLFPFAARPGTWRLRFRSRERRAVLVLRISTG